MADSFQQRISLEGADRIMKGLQARGSAALDGETRNRKTGPQAAFR